MSKRLLAPHPPAAPKAQRGIQSIEVGGQLLQALSHRGRPLSLKELAQEAGMSPAKAHPYLVSYGKLGLIAQDEASGHYGLGPLAMQLGLMSLQQVDPLHRASQRLPELAQRLQLTVALAVWGEHGPTIVRIEAAPTAVHVSMRHGTVMSLRNTASGQLFAAHLPKDEVKRVLAAQARQPNRKLQRAVEEAQQLMQIRTEGVAHSRDAVIPGISAVAAPIFDASGRMVVALIAMGPSAVLDAKASKTVARVLRLETSAISAALKPWQKMK